MNRKLQASAKENGPSLDPGGRYLPERGPSVTVSPRGSEEVRHLEYVTMGNHLIFLGGPPAAPSTFFRENLFGSRAQLMGLWWVALTERK